MLHLAIYDMDKTITRRPTWTPFLVRFAASVAPWRLMLLPIAGFLVLGYAIRLVGRARLKELTQGLMMGNHIDPETIASVARRFAADIVARGVYDQAIARIAEDRAAGRDVILATASCRFYVTAIAARLGIAGSNVIATESVTDGQGHVIAHIAGENCYGPAKLRMIEAWLSAQGLARDQVHARFYSDHASDAPALAWADEAFAVCPHGPLRTMAQTHGWEILDWAD